MERIKNLDQYKDIIRQCRTRHDTVDSNCFLMKQDILTFIGDEALYWQEYDSGIGVFADEGGYYNLYYYADSNTPFPEFRQDKPLLIEEINARGRRDAYLSRVEPKLKKAGFTKEALNYEYSLSVSEYEKRFHNEGKSRLQDIEKAGFNIVQCGQRYLGQVFDLWHSAFEPREIPWNHYRFLEERCQHAACIIDEDDNVLCTEWYCDTGNVREGRHLVTRKDHYHMGLATSILHYWLDEAVCCGLVQAKTWIADGNEASEALHRKVGFARTGKTSTQYTLK